MMNYRLSYCLTALKRLPLGEAVAKIGSSEPILVTDEGKTGSKIMHIVG